MISFKQFILLELTQSAIKKAIDIFVKAGIDKDLATTYVNKFNVLQQKHMMQGVDIFNMKFDDLKKKIDASEPSKTQTKKTTKLEDAEVVFENDYAKVIIPLSMKASCTYGAGTKWCISGRSDNQFNRYLKQGAMFYFILPKNKAGEKIAVVVSGKNEIIGAYDSEDYQQGVKWLKENALEPMSIPENIFKYKKITPKIDMKSVLEFLDDDSMDITATAKGHFIQIVGTDFADLENAYSDYGGSGIDFNDFVLPYLNGDPEALDQYVFSLNDLFGNISKENETKILSILKLPVTDSLEHHAEEIEDNEELHHAIIDSGMWTAESETNKKIMIYILKAFHEVGIEIYTEEHKWHHLLDMTNPNDIERVEYAENEGGVARYIFDPDGGFDRASLQVQSYGGGWDNKTFNEYLANELKDIK